MAFLPEIIYVQARKALAGDAAACKFFSDRIFGRTAKCDAPPFQMFGDRNHTLSALFGAGAASPQSGDAAPSEAASVRQRDTPSSSPKHVSFTSLDTPLPSEERAEKGEGQGVRVEALAGASEPVVSPPTAVVNEARLDQIARHFAGQDHATQERFIAGLRRAAEEAGDPVEHLELLRQKIAAMTAPAQYSKAV